MIQSKTPQGIRAVAIFEAAKGALVLIVGFGGLALIHRDVQAVAEHLVQRMHLNPAHEYPRIFIQAASHVTDAHLWATAWLALAYSMVRAAEAYGLWHGRRWAEWFALVSAALYLPIEIYEMIFHWHWIKCGIFLANVVIVLYVGHSLYKSRRRRRIRSAGDGLEGDL